LTNEKLKSGPAGEFSASGDDLGLGTAIFLCERRANRRLAECAVEERNFGGDRASACARYCPPSE
jgi:hypothetical protein